MLIPRTYNTNATGFYVIDLSCRPYHGEVKSGLAFVRDNVCRMGVIVFWYRCAYERELKGTIIIVLLQSSPFSISLSDIFSDRREHHYYNLQWVTCFSLKDD